MKKKLATVEDDSTPPKKIKLDTKGKKNVENKVQKVTHPKDTVQSQEQESKFTKSPKKGDPTNIKDAKAKKFPPKGKGKFNKANQKPEKIEDWVKFKKEKKELKLKRKQGKNNFDLVTKAKKIGEDLRRKTLKGGEEKRAQLINQLHNIVKGQYAKFVLAHDTARIVQWLLKYASKIVIQQISKELIPATVDMLQSKYGIYCVKRLLKYGDTETRSQVIDGMYGHAVKLASHAVSAPVIDYAYTEWASSVQKQYLVQEFYGDLYKNSKDPEIKHIRDTYKNTNSLKAATLSATKANLTRILNKTLLDSALVQTVLNQFLSECNEEDKKEFISQLAPHIVVISNSRDGARAAMQCIWHGTNKDRKVIMKTLKEHVVELSKHEHGHNTVITLLDSADDTVLLNKIILSDLLKNAKELAVSEWGRKVLLWLVAPADLTIFHPVFVNELKQGRESASCKKSPDIRQKEILNNAIPPLLDLIEQDAAFWLSNASLAMEMSAIVKTGMSDNLEKVYNKVVEVLTDLDWKIKEGEKEILGIEHAGIHMVLKKLAQHDKVNIESGNVTFGFILAEKLNDEVLNEWIKFNRGCFLLVAVFENGSEETKKVLKAKLEKSIKKIKKQKTPGANILLKKLH